MSIKINKSQLHEFKYDKEIFGSWVKHLDELSLKFKTNFQTL